jgi:enamine deaminase RidA (YjgF/YER057c/UK114 family)
MATEVRPANWPPGSGYSHGFSAEGRAVFVAGQIGWDPVTQTVVPGAMAAQVRQAFANIVTVLEAAGARPTHLVRLTWFITDRDAYLRERKAIGTAYREVIGRHFPPMSVIVVAGLLEPGAVVEIEATAVIPSESQSNSTGA